MKRLTWFLAVTLSACSALPEPTVDGGTARDSGAADAAIADAGQVDAGEIDAGPLDAGEVDAGVADAGKADAGTDGGVRPDSGIPSDGGAFSTDRTLFFGSPRCAGGGFALCEDFESGVINPAIWTVIGAPSVAVGTAEHARGARALHITKTANGAAYIRETMTFPAVNNSYYGRAFMKFVSMPARPMTYSHWTVLAASGNIVKGEIRVGGQLPTNVAARQLFGVGTDNRTQDAGTGDWTTSDADPTGNAREVPLNEWLCIEWLHQGSTNETRFWWDAVEHPSLHTTPAKHGGNSNPFILPQFTNLWIGWQEYQPSTETFEMWVDEIAIDEARVGCVR